MGVLRPLAWGLASGGAGYLGMYVYSTSNLKKVDAGLKALRHEINPDAPPPIAIDQGSGDLAGLAAYKTKASESFRENWNSSIRWMYSKFLTSLRNPYLSPSSGAESSENTSSSSA